MQNRIDRVHLGSLVASIVSGRSTCRRLHVGALLVLEDRPIAWGYNGAASGEPHCGEECEHAADGCPNSIHAEANVIAWCARKGIATEGSVLFVTTAPCKACAGLLINAGIVEVYYQEPYRDPAGLERLRKSGVQAAQYRVVPIGPLS